MAAKKNFYAIETGGEKRIFASWDECRQFRDKNPNGARYKGFATWVEAMQYLGLEADRPQNYYVVKAGRHPGIYETWEDCKRQVDGFEGAVFRKFPEREMAEKWIASTGEAKGHCSAYTDGSFNEPIQKWGYGVILIDSENGSEFEFSGSGGEDSETRNIAGEIHGAVRAVKEALLLGYTSITIHHDYEGVGKWATHEWRAKQDLTRWYVKTIQEYGQKIKIQFQHVPAHTGVQYNERVDGLAKIACGIVG